MIGKKKGPEDPSSNYEVGPIVKKISGWDVALMVLVVLVVILAIVIKLNQIFHWWLTLPW